MLYVFSEIKRMWNYFNTTIVKREKQLINLSYDFPFTYYKGGIILFRIFRPD